MMVGLVIRFVSVWKFGMMWCFSTGWVSARIFLIVIAY